MNHARFFPFFPYCYDNRLAPLWLPFRPWPGPPAPYRWWTAVGARLSMVDDGLTFGTNATAGVCIHFDPRIRRVIGLVDHSALTVTVADPEGLLEALNDAIADHRDH